MKVFPVALEEKKSIPLPVKPVIVVQAQNGRDGMGDVSHALNAGLAIAKNNPDYQIVFRIQWQWRMYNDDADKQRLKILAGKLAYFNLISTIPEIFNEKNSDKEEMRQAINQATKNRFYLFIQDNHRDFTQHRIDLFKDAKLYVDVSIPIHSHYDIHPGIEQSPAEIKEILTYLGSPRLFFSEHNDIGEAENLKTLSIPFENMYATGFGTVPHEYCHENKAKQRNFIALGLFLEDRLQKTPASKAKLLSSINHSKFHRALHGKNSIDEKMALAIIEKTVFVPCYFLHSKDLALPSLIASCASAFGKDAKVEQVFIKGNIKSQELFTKANQRSLKENGFSELKLYDYSNENSGKGLRKTFNKKNPPKVLKVFSGAPFSEPDYDCFVQLSTEINGCSGDNTLQEAFSNGAIPILAWHGSPKAQTLSELGKILQKHLNASEWPLCIAYLKIYQDYVNHVLDKKEVFNTIPKHITPELIAQWKTVCAYVIKEHNAYGPVCAEVAKALRQNPVAECERNKMEEKKSIPLPLKMEDVSHTLKAILAILENNPDYQKYITPEFLAQCKTASARAEVAKALKATPEPLPAAIPALGSPSTDLFKLRKLHEVTPRDKESSHNNSPS